MNVNTRSQQLLKRQGPPSLNKSESHVTSDPTDTFQAAKPNEAKDGFGATLGKFALLGLAVAGATGCVPQAETPVEQQTTTDQNTSGEVDLSKTSKPKFNWTNGEVEHAREGDRLRFNPLEGEFEYAGENDKMRFNWAEGKFERAPEDAKLKFNFWSGEFEYR